MIRVTARQRNRETDEILLEGWLRDEDVPLLLKEAARTRRPGRQLRIDLSGLRGLGSLGIAALKRWHGEGICLHDPSLFVQALLRAHGLELPCGSEEGRPARTRASPGTDKSL
jgi:hypothetical protein